MKSKITSFKSIATVVALSLALLGTAGFKACEKTEKDRNVAFARDIAGAVKAGCQAAIKKDSSKWKARCDTAVNDGSKLIDAFASSDSTSIATLVRDVLPVFTDLATEFTTNDIVLGLMAGGQIALNFFINHFLDTASASTKAGKARTAAAAAESSDWGAVDRFRALPQFGCRLQPARCQ